MCYFSILLTNSFAQMTWTSVPESIQWQARFQHAPVVFNHHVWLLGGENNGVALNDVWKSGNGIDWTQACKNAGWSVRSCFPSVVYKDRIWIFGGGKADGENLNDVWYSEDGQNWTQAASSADWEPRKSFAVIDFKNKMWLFGGDTTAYKHGTNDIWYSKGLTADKKR
jgi:hypothetical protein